LMAFSHFLYSSRRSRWTQECRFFYSLHSNRLLILLTLYSVRTFHPSCSPVSLGISTTFLSSRVSFYLTVPSFLIIPLGKHILCSPLWSMVSNLDASVSTTSGSPESHDYSVGTVAVWQGTLSSIEHNREPPARRLVIFCHTEGNIWKPKRFSRCDVDLTLVKQSGLYLRCSDCLRTGQLGADRTKNFAIQLLFWMSRFQTQSDCLVWGIGGFRLSLLTSASTVLQIKQESFLSTSSPICYSLTLV